MYTWNVLQGRQHRHRRDPWVDHSQGTAGRDQRGLSAPVWVCRWGLSWDHNRGGRRKAGARRRVCTQRQLSDGTADIPHHQQSRYATAQPSAPEAWKIEADVIQLCQVRECSAASYSIWIFMPYYLSIYTFWIFVEKYIQDNPGENMYSRVLLCPSFSVLNQLEEGYCHCVSFRTTTRGHWFWETLDQFNSQIMNIMWFAFKLLRIAFLGMLCTKYYICQ